MDRYLLRLAAIALTSITYVSVAGSQTRSPRAQLGEVVPQIDNETYERVLNLVFPVTAEAARGVIFTLTLRIRPSFDAESQITITQGGGANGAVEYVAAEHNIYATVNELLRTTGEGRADALAKHIQVRRQVINLPAPRLFELQQELVANLQSMLSILPDGARRVYHRETVNIINDANSYELWYAQGLAKFSGSFTDGEAYSSTLGMGAAFGGWARELHDLIKRLAQRPQ